MNLVHILALLFLNLRFSRFFSSVLQVNPIKVPWNWPWTHPSKFLLAHHSRSSPQLFWWYMNLCHWKQLYQITQESTINRPTITKYWVCVAWWEVNCKMFHLVNFMGMILSYIHHCWSKGIYISSKNVFFSFHAASPTFWCYFVWERSATYNSKQRCIIPAIHFIFLSSTHSKLSTVEYEEEESHVKAVSRLGRKINMRVLIW